MATLDLEALVNAPFKSSNSQGNSLTPKSILKKTVTQAVEEPPPQAKGQSKADRNREIAVYHANIIQAQKDVEAEILEALEELIEFPTTPSTSTSINPSSADIAAFKEYVTPFQPSDYDSLLEERRIAQKCGYVLCNNPPKKTSTGGGKFKILGRKKGQEFRVVEREKTDCWCCQDCARRALYVKVQLDEEPAWTRRGGSAPEIQILIGVEDDGLDESKVQQRRLEEDMDMLALERGDLDKPARSVGMVKKVVEKDYVSAPEAPSHDESVNAVEGYEPKGISLAIRTKEPVKRELGDRDWDM